MTVRLDKWVAQYTTHSRADVRKLLRRGHVTVNGEVERDGRVHVGPTDAVTLRGEPVSAPAVLLAWHKPAGVLTTTDDPTGRDSLATHLPELLAVGYHPVGRLDKDTDGLLLLSTDGALTQRLLHPSRHVGKRYQAVVEGTPSADIIAQLEAGVETAHGTHKATDIEIDGDRVTLTVFEGKNRMVRRMLHNVGHSVVALTRLGFGPVALGDLALGATREVDAASVEALRQAVQ